LIALSKAHDCSAQSEHRDNSESTLVLVPTTLVGQWWHEIQKHLNGLSAAVCTLFDIFESRQDADLDEESLQSWKLICNCKTPCSTGFRQYDSETCSSLLSKHDIVLSTYSNLQRKGRLPQVVHLKGILRNTSWKRIVLDECQEIRSLNSIISKECSQLIARNRYAFENIVFVFIFFT
jgi:SNF2 family DNA or RNA helicase